jgi:hypothetical protein
VSEPNNDRDLAADLEPLADEQDDVPVPPLVAIGKLVLRAERQREAGSMTAGDLAALRFVALQLVADQPESRQRELIAAFDDI